VGLFVIVIFVFDHFLFVCVDGGGAGVGVGDWVVLGMYCYLSSTSYLCCLVWTYLLLGLFVECFLVFL